MDVAKLMYIYGTHVLCPVASMSVSFVVNTWYFRFLGMRGLGKLKWRMRGKAGVQESAPSNYHGYLRDHRRDGSELMR